VTTRTCQISRLNLSPHSLSRFHSGWSAPEAIQVSWPWSAQWADRRRSWRDSKPNRGAPRAGISVAVSHMLREMWRRIGRLISHARRMRANYVNAGFLWIVDVEGLRLALLPRLIHCVQRHWVAPAIFAVNKRIMLELRRSLCAQCDGTSSITSSYMFYCGGTISSRISTTEI